MATLSTHVLDAAQGRPADGVRVWLEQLDDASGTTVTAEGVTDADGRVGRLGPELAPGTYRLGFDTGGYFGRRDVPTFYPRVDITFLVSQPDQHYHVPVLLCPFAYSTYRGS